MTSESQRKAGYLLPDQIDGHELVDVCLKIPNDPDYRAAFLHTVWRMGQWWVWEKSYSAGDTRATQAAAYWREILSKYLEMDCMSCCNDVKIIKSTNNNIWREMIYQRWDGSDPQSVNPSAPTAGSNFEGDGSAERVDALCMAVKTYVESYFDHWTREAEIQLAATITVVGLITGVLGLGIVPILAIAGLAFISDIALDAARDQAARNAIICCMKDALTGSPITQANFITSLDNCGFTAGSSAAIIRDIIASDLPDDANWVLFLDNLGKAYTLALAGVQDCPCNGWSVQWLSGDGPIPDSTLVWGTYNAAADRYEAGPAGNINVATLVAQVDQLFSPGLQVTRLYMQAQMANDGFSARTSVIQILQNGEWITVASTDRKGNVTFALEWTGGATIDGVRWHAAGRTSGPTTSHFIRMLKVVIEGNGDNPFGV